MRKSTYKLQNLFKSKEQREIEARAEFNHNRNAFKKYERELAKSIKDFTRMAQEAELSGNHQNAVSCAQFIRKLQRSQTGVQALIQRFEMMQSATRLAGIMGTFSEACAKMGFQISDNINLKDMWRNTATIEQSLGKLDTMTQQMDMIFDSIDMGMSYPNELSQEESEKDAEALLDNIMGRYNTVNGVGEATAAPAAQVAAPEAVAPVAQAAAPQAAAPQAAAPQATAEDDTTARLQKMMKELKG